MGSICSSTSRQSDSASEAISLANPWSLPVLEILRHYFPLQTFDQQIVERMLRDGLDMVSSAVRVRNAEILLAAYDHAASVIVGRSAAERHTEEGIIRGNGSWSLPHLEILQHHFPHQHFNQQIVDRMLKNGIDMVSSAMRDHNPHSLLAAYNHASVIIGKSTAERLAEKGVIIGSEKSIGQLIYFATLKPHGIPVIFKNIQPHELAGYRRMTKIVKPALGNNSKWLENHLVPFEYQTTECKWGTKELSGATMEIYPAVLADYPGSNDWPCQKRLIDQMEIAVEVLHNLGLIHMDLKPLNIAVDSQGNFFLFDYGGVVEKGTASSLFTSIFIPKNLRPTPADSNKLTAHPTLDFWAILVCLWDQIQVAGTGIGFHTCTAPPTWKLAKDLSSSPLIHQPSFGRILDKADPNRTLRVDPRLPPVEVKELPAIPERGSESQSLSAAGRV